MIAAMGASANRRLVERLYAAVRVCDAAELEALIGDAFAPDAVMRLSPSLPHGGDHTGRETIAALLLGLVRAQEPAVQPDRIHVERILEDGDRVVAEVTYPWKPSAAPGPIPMSAIERFTLRDGRITEMKVSYWDTAACVEVLGERPVS